MKTTVVIIADDHAGSPAGLFPGENWELEDGNNLEPNDWQDTLRGHFLDCAAQVADWRRGGRLIVIHAGDATEGVHHGNVQLLTTRIDEQERMHIAAMGEFLSLVKFNRRSDQLIYLAGTEAHTGTGNSSTERIVRALLKKDELDGREVRIKLFADIDGVLFDVAHKGFRLGAREHTRVNSIRAYLESRWSGCAKRGLPVPRYVIRAHMHTFAHIPLEDLQGHMITEGFLMPSFKLPDDYAGMEVQEAIGSIGVLPFTIRDGVPAWHRCLMTCDPFPVEVL
jgi:hypothetical protein